MQKESPDHGDACSSSHPSGSTNSPHSSESDSWTKIGQPSSTLDALQSTTSEEERQPKPARKKLIDYTKQRSRNKSFDCLPSRKDATADVEEETDTIIHSVSGRGFSTQEGSASPMSLPADSVHSNQSQQEKEDRSSRRNLVRSRTFDGLISSSTQEDQEEDDGTVEFFLKVPINRNRRRRGSDPGRIHENQIMNDLRESFHRRKLSLRKKVNLSPSSTPLVGNSDASAAVSPPARRRRTQQDSLEADDLLRILAAAKTDSEEMTRDDSLSRRTSEDSLDRSGRSQGRRRRSSVIKRSIESMGRRGSSSSAPSKSK